MTSHLTREYFEETLDQKLDQKLDEKIKDFVTKDYLDKKLENYVTKNYLDEAFEKNFEKQRKEYERYIGGLAEDFQSKLSVVAELAVSTAEDMTFIKQYIQDHAELHAQVNFRLNALESVR